MLLSTSRINRYLFLIDIFMNKYRDNYQILTAHLAQSINSISVPTSRIGQIYWIFTVNHTDQQIPVPDWYFHDHHFQTHLLVDWSMIVAILLRDQSNKNYSLQDLNTNWRCKGVTSDCSLVQRDFPQGLFAVITGNSHTTLIPRDLQEYNRSCANNLSIPAALQTS